MFKVFYAVSPSAMLDPVGYASTGDFSQKYESVLPHQTKGMGAITMSEMFERFNGDICRIWDIRPMSVGDIFETLTGDRYIVDQVGFTKIIPPAILSPNEQDEMDLYLCEEADLSYE